ncbi:MAG: FxDxF family PEP-CTERM protein [Caulobacteraceae bacterium]
MASKLGSVKFGRKGVAAIGAAAALAATLPASATTVITNFTPEPVGPGSIDGFTQFVVQPSEAGDTFDFTFDLSPGAGNVLSQLQASLASGSEAFSFGLYSGSPPTGTLIGNSSDITGPSLYSMHLTTSLYYLQMNSSPTVGSLVSGALSVASVPEPATWALLLAGFGLAGYAIRRRRGLARFA